MTGQRSLNRTITYGRQWPNRAGTTRPFNQTNNLSCHPLAALAMIWGIRSWTPIKRESEMLLTIGRRAAAFAVLIAALTLISRVPASAQSFTKDMEPIGIVMQLPDGRGIRLSIPAAYMHYRQSRSGGLQNTIIPLLLVYPEISPLALESKSDRERL